MGVAAAGGVFHQPGIAGPENLCAPVAHSDLHFAPQMNNQASFGQRVEVHGPQHRKLMDPHLRDLPQRAQLGMLRHMDFFDMAFAIRPGIDTVDAHTTPRCRWVVVRRLRPLALVKRRIDARDDRRPGSVPQPMVAQETRARADRRTATRWLDNLRSCSPRHAMTGIVRRPYALMARLPACTHGSPVSHACGPRHGSRWPRQPPPSLCGSPPVSRPSAARARDACVSLTPTWL